MMSSAEFDRLVKAHRLRGRNVDGARLVLTQGRTSVEAAAAVGIYPQGVTRAVATLRGPLCPKCSQPIRQPTKEKK